MLVQLLLTALLLPLSQSVPPGAVAIGAAELFPGEARGVGQAIRPPQNAERAGPPLLPASAGAPSGSAASPDATAGANGRTGAADADPTLPHARRQLMTDSNPGPVRRLRLRWSNGVLTLDGERRVPQMTLPASEPVATGRQVPSGAWFDLKKADGTVIYRGKIRDPREARVEMANPDGTFTNAEVPPTEDTFEILVPDDLPSGGEVTFFATSEDIHPRALSVGPRMDQLGTIRLGPSPR
jgi:hypothetical protein